MHRRVGVERPHDGQNLGRRRRLGQVGAERRDADLLARRPLHAHVRLRVAALADDDDGEAGHLLVCWVLCLCLCLFVVWCVCEVGEREGGGWLRGTWSSDRRRRRPAGRRLRERRDERVTKVVGRPIWRVTRRERLERRSRCVCDSLQGSCRSTHTTRRGNAAIFFWCLPSRCRPPPPPPPLPTDAPCHAAA